MSLVKIQGNASGTGTFTVAAPNSNNNQTLTLPDATGTLLSSASTSGFPAGTVKQVVSSADNTVVSTTGATILTINITPTSSSSKILLIGYANLVVTANTNAYGVLYIRKNGNNITVNGTAVYAVSGFNTATTNEPALSLSYLDSPATTSSIAYTLYIARGSGSTTSVATQGVYSLTAMEIAA